jgi:UDPglucose 6-dehydrogenase
MFIREGIDEAAGEGGEHEAAEVLEVTSNPEFRREGSAAYDSLFPDRIVVGSVSGVTISTSRVVYEPIIEQNFLPSLILVRWWPFPSSPQA